MSMFRSPLYLDLETLVPLANYHDIEVMVDVQLSQRDLGQRSGGGGVRASIPLPGSPGIEFSGSKGSEAEVTQARTIKDNPASALNRLVDALTREGDLITELTDRAITRRQLVELEGDWEVSPATDIGGFLAGMVRLMSQNPAALSSKEVPPEFMSLMTAGPTGGPTVLDCRLDDDDQTQVLALLSSDNITHGNTLDDLEGDRSVFGYVDTVVADGGEYSLEKFFLSGLGRAVRRAFKPADLLPGMSEMLGREVTSNDLSVKGPLIVVKAVAVY